MRRTLMLAALSTVLLAGAGCSDTGSPGGTAGSASPSASAGSSAPVSAADKQVCTDTEKLIEDSTRRFGDEIAKAVQSGSLAEGEQKALTAVRGLFDEWARGLRTQSGKATDPELRSALTEYADALDQIKGQLNTAADLAKLQQLNTPEIDAANRKITRICG